MLDRFQRAFADLVEGPGPVVVQGGIWTFAHVLRAPSRALPGRILAAMIEVVGPARTLVMPSYTFSFAKSRKFDVQHTPGETGVLAETMRKHPGAKRTLRGFYSHVLIGQDAARFQEKSPQHAWGPGSDGEIFLSLDATYVSMGMPWHETCSLLHMPELLARVPYRFFKRFNGTGIDANGQAREISETMFVRSMNVPSETEFSAASKHFATLPQVRSSDQFPMSSLPARVIVEEAGKMLARDPFVFVKNRDEVKAWIANGKLKEIATLAPDEDAGLN